MTHDSFEEFNSPEVREMELMLLPVQDLLVGTSMNTGTRGSTTGKMMMLAICFDRIIMNITDTMMLTVNLTMNLTMPMILKFTRNADLELKITTQRKNDTHRSPHNS